MVGVWGLEYSLPDVTVWVKTNVGVSLGTPVLLRSTFGQLTASHHLCSMRQTWIIGLPHDGVVTSSPRNLRLSQSRRVTISKLRLLRAVPT